MTGALRLRVRGPEGQATINIDRQASWRDLLHEISEKSRVADFDLKHGFPPRALNLESIDDQTRLADLPFQLNGEQLTISPRNIHTNHSSPLAETQRPPEAVTASQHLGRPRNPQGTVEDDPPAISVPQLEGVMILRVMPDDNSCMFRALSSAVLGPALDGMTELRSAVAQEIQANPDFYTAGILGKAPDDYCRWIQREDAWGGGIELSILSEKFDVEICSIDVQTLRVDTFNEGRPTRCILVYSGIHYDVCAVTASRGADPGADRKVFDVLRIDDEDFDGGALEAARELCRVLQGRHYFTDTHGFAVKCNTCGAKGNGQQWAQRHAKSTGHGDYGEAD